LGEVLLTESLKVGAERNVPGSIQGHFDRAMIVMQQIDLSSGLDDATALLSPFKNVAALVISEDLKFLAINDAAKINLKLKVDADFSSVPIEASDANFLAKEARKLFSAPISNPAIFSVRSIFDGNFLIFQMRLATLKSGENVVVAVTSDLSWPNGFGEILQAAFGVTSAEVEVIRLLIDCGSVKEIAERRGRSIDTIRAQIKAILAKTETKSQIELIRIVLSMMDIASSALRNNQTLVKMNEGSGRLKPLPYQTVYDENDRRLDYLILGDPKGKPVLYITAEYCFSRWPASAEAFAEEKGIKVIVPIRAGYGESDLLPKDCDFCQGIAPDILCILDQEKVQSLPAITMSDDFNFVIQVEKIRSGTIRAIIASPGGLPFLNEEQVYRMHKWYRFIQSCARKTPKMLPYMIKMGFHLIKRIGKKSFFKTIYEDSPADIAAIDDPEIFEALEAGNSMAMESGYKLCETFARQTIFEQDPGLVAHVHWCRGKIPMHFMVGLQDPSQPPETLVEQRQEFDWIDFREYPDAGQLLLFTKWRDVLALTEDYV
ncbi:MAG: helix-turn-helix transcriptional regulator, partial [Pseudorhodobacter sp.]